jgi:hypothetical protein
LLLHKFLRQGRVSHLFLIHCLLIILVMHGTEH